MNAGSPAPFHHDLEMKVPWQRTCCVPDANFPWPLEEVRTPILQMKKLRLNEVICLLSRFGKWPSWDLTPYRSQVSHTLGFTGRGLCG